ncbi:uncharacterized protein B0P05DRAFT_508026 [Gilbertella persicaria]|uniref:Sugar phosphate transporter domain-containing protein n=1 Tax=Rhizopus stolonifer TaxID=4846 RepID=A0A367KRV2_RHIST|nr:uncharacterized protein B0P05DRAFT_508026 [Gilbertella persicaria]KAI8083317.1 hypothetical protein B0P05DRAFT_508026 [Gilbertella persicaria]RCI04929.1 hypothetical protein CU098_013139 [Rhizopus stolonifer]
MSSNLEDLPLPASSFSSKGRGEKLFMNANKRITTITMLYITISIAATFFNKLLFTYSEYKFPYPFFTVVSQLLITVLFMFIWSKLKPFQHPLAQIPAFSWDSTVALRIAPLTTVYMCVIIFNPLYLQHVEATNYQFTHSLTIAFSLLFSYLMLQAETSRNVKSSCILVMFGTCVGSMGYLNFSLVGAFYSLAWPAIVALYGIYLKKTLTASKNDIWCVIQYNSIMSIGVLTLLVILSGELSDIFSNVWFWDEFGFWLQMVLTAMTGFCINAIMLLMLVHTSPLTVTVASVSRTAIQALLVTVIFGNRMSLLNVIGILISLAGSGCYIFLRLGETKL